VSYQIRNQLIDTLGPKSTWTGASSDIHTVAWSPDGQCFAAGAVAVTDPDSMQYNRPNVLLYGNTISGNIHELGLHSVVREKTSAGPNSTHAMHITQDPKLYTTVSSVAFAPSGNLMYSAGYDGHVNIWDVTKGSKQPDLAHIRWQHRYSDNTNDWKVGKASIL
jgi:WD40 repeat protein